MTITESMLENLVLIHYLRQSNLMKQKDVWIERYAPICVSAMAIRSDTLNATLFQRIPEVFCKLISQVQNFIW